MPVDVASALVELSHRLGDPTRDLALAAEGNVSHRLDPDTMLVKASGCSLGTLGREDLVEVRLAPLVELLDSSSAGDADVSRVYAESTSGGRRPSVEAVLHAAILRETEAVCVAHTHPVAVNSLLCSTSAHLLTQGALFPDQVVMLGRRQVLVPYVDPGLALARAVRESLRAFVDAEGQRPKVLYLRNHGLFALGSSVEDALGITFMAVKSASILLGAIQAGGPVFLSDADVARIDSREDEHFRRSLLERSGGSS